jgi:tRNA pseudouridine32 synthase/23S rRNA pseudouridine746 synthase
MQKFAQAFESVRAGISIVDFLADEVPLSKSKIKEVIQKGGVWLHREGEEPLRVRRAKDTVKLRDDIHIYYDEEFLAYKLPPLRNFITKNDYSVWLKPEGVMQEESLYGDHLSLAKLIERDIPHDIDCYFVNPDDAEVTGLMLVAHSQVLADSLIEQNNANTIEKNYRVSIKGKLPEEAKLLVENQAYDLSTLKYNDYNNTSLIIIESAQALESNLLNLLKENNLIPLDDEQLQCCSIRFKHPSSIDKKCIKLP